MNAFGIIFSNIHDDNIPELTQVRTLGSIPFLGRYRLIDFALSNMVDSGISKVGIITKYNYQSLMDHVGSGKDWDLARKQGGLHILPPFGVKDNVPYTTRLEALRGAKGFIDKSTEEYVVLSDCDCIFSMKFDEVIAYSQEKNADITLVYVKDQSKKYAGADNIVTFDMEEDGKVSEFYFDKLPKGEGNFYSNVCIMKRELLSNLLGDALARGYNHFSKDILAKNVNKLRIYGYEHTGYFVAITSFNNYYTESLNLLDKKLRDSVFRISDVFTKVKDSVPTKYTSTAKVSNSLIADGCVIEGTVENSIIFRGVKIEKGAVIKNCILFQGTYICSDAYLNAIVADKNVVVKSKKVLSGDEDHPFYLGKRTIV